jgi:hypothetical protein
MSEKFLEIKEILDSGKKIQICIEALNGDKWYDIVDNESFIKYYTESPDWYEKQRYRISGEKTLI